MFLKIKQTKTLLKMVKIQSLQIIKIPFSLHKMGFYMTIHRNNKQIRRNQRDQKKLFK